MVLGAGGQGSTPPLPSLPELLNTDLLTNINESHCWSTFKYASQLYDHERLTSPAARSRLKGRQAEAISHSWMKWTPGGAVTLSEPSMPLPLKPATTYHGSEWYGVSRITQRSDTRWQTHRGCVQGCVARPLSGRCVRWPNFKGDILTS